jgi:intracellular septation protein
MKLLFDFFPVLLFFIAYKAFDIYVATWVAIVSSTLQVMVFWLKYRKFETTHLMTFGIILVFGGLTIYLQDEQFIKWKPTVVNWLFGFLFLASQWVGEKTMIQRMMGSNLTMPSAIWRTLNLGWTLFFFLIGGINYYVMSYFNTDTWVNFKLFGMLGLTFLFVLLQSFYLSRHLPDSTTEED